MRVSNKLSKFSIEELKRFKENVLIVQSKEELLEMIDRTIQQKEEELINHMNSKFLVDWFNIDKQNITLLHTNGIDNLVQLRNLTEENLREISGMTESSYEQICWARDFFDATSMVQNIPAKRDNMTIVKVIVKQVEECNKKHPNV